MIADDKIEGFVGYSEEKQVFEVVEYTDQKADRYLSVNNMILKTDASDEQILLFLRTRHLKDGNAIFTRKIEQPHAPKQNYFYEVRALSGELSESFAATGSKFSMWAQEGVPEEALYVPMAVKCLKSNSQGVDVEDKNHIQRQVAVVIPTLFKPGKCYIVILTKEANAGAEEYKAIPLYDISNDQVIDAFNYFE